MPEPQSQPYLTRPKTPTGTRKRAASDALGQEPLQKRLDQNRPVSPPLATRQGRYVKNTPLDQTPSALPPVAEQQPTDGTAAANGQQAPATEAPSTSASETSTATTTPAPPPAIRHQDVPPLQTWDNVSAEHGKALITAKQIIADVRTQLRFRSANQEWNFARSEGQRDEVTKRVQFLYQCASFYVQDELRRYIARHEPAQRAAWVDSRLATYATQLEEKKEPQADSLKQEFRRALTAALGPAVSEASAAEASNVAVKSAMDDLRSQVMNRKPRLRALAAQAIEAGNCDQMAALTFMLARERFERDYLVQLVSVPGHIFCRVGKRHWRDEQFIVIDPWPREAYPILAGHHLGYRHVMTLQRSKPGLHACVSNDKQERYARFRESMRWAFAHYEANTWVHQKPSDWYWTGNSLHNCLYPTPADQSTIVTYYVNPATTEEEERAQAVYETMQSLLQAVDEQQTPTDDATLQALLREIEGQQAPAPDAALQALLQGMEAPSPRQVAAGHQPPANQPQRGEQQRGWFDGLGQLYPLGSPPYGFDNF